MRGASEGVRSVHEAFRLTTLPVAVVTRTLFLLAGCGSGDSRRGGSGICCTQVATSPGGARGPESATAVRLCAAASRPRRAVGRRCWAASHAGSPGSAQASRRCTCPGHGCALPHRRSARGRRCRRRRRRRRGGPRCRAPGGRARRRAAPRAPVRSRCPRLRPGLKGAGARPERLGGACPAGRRLLVRRCVCTVEPGMSRRAAAAARAPRKRASATPRPPRWPTAAWCAGMGFSWLPREARGSPPGGPDWAGGRGCSVVGARPRTP
jgi:hypothetical protein